MQAQQINRFSANALIVLALIALLMVVGGYFQAPQTDEGTAAHIFQLSIVAFVLTIMVFLATADWKQPWRAVGRLAFPATALAVAFGALYYLEHYWWSRVP